MCTLARVLLLASWIVAGWVSPALAQSVTDVEIFVARGCPHCAAAKPFIERLQQERPDLRVRVVDVADNRVARDRLAALARARGITTVGVPAFLVGNNLTIGWAEDGSTEREVRSHLPSRPAAGETTAAPTPQPIPPPREREGMEVPLLGFLNASRIGLPAFSFAVGFVDGVNPCAMWALLYVLTLLVPMRDRRKMLLIGGTFVAAGGALYFAFIAAWLELFLFIGLSRIIQVVLGSAAIVAAALHVKDAIALGRGPSLSIPGAARPKIYERARRILTADNLAGALAAVVVLSLLVNVVEVLCTAGLPAVYTQVLASHDLSRGAYYGNLALYIGAYILDDTIVLGVAVTTLSRRRLQEKAGRWLKLVSGVVLGALGLVLLLRPEWLT